MKKFLVVLATATCLAACAQRPGALSTASPSASPPAKHAVPQVATLAVGEVDKVLLKAQLVPILRYEPGIVTGAGTVVGTEPPAGAMVAQGEVVTVIVAGSPGATLGEYVAAHRETYVGMGADANGVIVVGVHRNADLQHELGELTKLAHGAPFRVQSCALAWVDLQRVQLDLARREFVPGADKLAFAMTIDPLACAVRLTIDLSDAEIAQLSARYPGALVIQKGSASRT
jgi:hypothetical protein